MLRRRDGTGGGVGVAVVAAMVEMRAGSRGRWAWMGCQFGLFTESRGSEIWGAKSTVELISNCTRNRRSRVDDFLERCEMGNIRGIHSLSLRSGRYMHNNL